jgi:hypothetical protein
MNYVSSVAERAIISVDRFINQAMTHVWTSTLKHRCPGREFTPPPWSVQTFAGENYGGGDFCAPEPESSTEHDQPLE